MNLNSWAYNAAGRFAYELAPRDMAVGDCIPNFHGSGKYAVATASVKRSEPVMFVLYDAL